MVVSPFRFDADVPGAAALDVAAFAVDERLSGDFRVAVEIATVAPAPLEDAVGRAGRFTFESEDGVARTFRGIVTEVRAAGARYGRWRQRVELRSALWSLRLVRRSRVFDGLSIREIVQAVLREHGLPARWLARAPSPKRHPCHQYRESDHDFLRRLLAREGLWYHFEDDGSSCWLVVGDEETGFVDRTNTPLPIVAPGGMRAAGPAVWAVEARVRRQARRVQLREFDVERPSSTRVSEAGMPTAPDAVMLHPGDLGGDDARRSLIELERLAAREGRGRASSSAAWLAPAQKIAFAAGAAPTRGALFVTRVRHRGGLAGLHPTLVSGVDERAPRYENVVDFLLPDVPFRPLGPRAPKALGVQSAIVVGPPGEEIHLDEDGLGRVRVRFPWDRETSRDGAGGCWARVAHRSAGNGFGALLLPRVGQEVLIRFAEGNPDRPIVIGSAYNGEQATPVALPGDKTASTVRSRSSPGSHGYSELAFQDAAGAEELRLRAQRDLVAQAGRDKVQRIGGNEGLTVGHDRRRTVAGDQALRVGGSDETRIGRSQRVRVALTSTASVGMADGVKVGGARNTLVGLAHHLTVGGADMEAIGGASLLTVAGGYVRTVGGAASRKVGGDAKVTVAAELQRDVSEGSRTTITGSVTDHVLGDDSRSAVGVRFASKRERQSIAETARLEIGTEATFGARTALLGADAVTVIVGGKEVLAIKDGAVALSGKEITVDGSAAFKSTSGKIKKQEGKGLGQQEAERAEEEVEPSLTARWSKRLVFPVHNKHRVPPRAPRDEIPEAAIVGLLVDTAGVPDGSAAEIQIRHAATGAAVKGGRLTGLVVKENRVVVEETGRRPVWSFEAKHLPWDPWNKSHYFFEVKVQHEGLSGHSPKDWRASPRETLRLGYWDVLAADADADTGTHPLSTQEEIAEVGGIIERVTAHRTLRRAFSHERDWTPDPVRGDRRLRTETWGSVLRNSFLYHQSSHGALADLVAKKQYDGDEEPPTPEDRARWSSVLYFGNTGFHKNKIADEEKVPSVPKFLAYANCCVTGWEPSLGKAFIERGTQSFIGFGTYIPDDDAREMARRFYRRWVKLHMNPAHIPAIFFEAGAPFAESMRPVLLGPGAGAIDPGVVTQMKDLFKSLSQVWK